MRRLRLRDKILSDGKNFGRATRTMCAAPIQLAWCPLNVGATSIVLSPSKPSLAPLSPVFIVFETWIFLSDPQQDETVTSALQTAQVASALHHQASGQRFLSRYKYWLHGSSYPVWSLSHRLAQSTAFCGSKSQEHKGTSPHIFLAAVPHTNFLF